MKTGTQWEYIMRDFLDLKCALKENEQDYLIDRLRSKGIRGSPLKIFPAFSVADCLVVVTDGMKPKHHWCYRRGKKRIETMNPSFERSITKNRRLFATHALRKKSKIVLHRDEDCRA